MNKDTGRKPPMAVQGEPRNLEEEIRRRAYELYEAQGREDGHDLDDWLRAEEVITGRRPASSPPEFISQIRQICE